MTVVPTRRSRPLAAMTLACAALAAAATAALGQPAAPPAAAAPPADFAVCSACHESTANARPSLGPNLWNIGGRKAGALPDYDYSPAMKASTTVWSADTL